MYLDENRNVKCVHENFYYLYPHEFDNHLKPDVCHWF